MSYKYVGPPYGRDEVYVGSGEYADRTDRRIDGRTPDRYIALSARRDHSDKDSVRI